jgi:hypothetical protein
VYSNLIACVVEYTPQAFLQPDLDLFFQNFSTSQVFNAPLFVAIDGGVAQTVNQSFNFNGESSLDLEYGMTLTDPQPVQLYQVGDVVEGGSFNNLYALRFSVGPFCSLFSNVVGSMPWTDHSAPSKVGMTPRKTVYIQIHCQEVSTNPNRVVSLNQQMSSVHHIHSTNQTLHQPTLQGNAMSTENWGSLVRRFYTQVVTEVSQVVTIFVCSPTGLGAPVPQDSFPVSPAHVHSSLQCAAHSFLLVGVQQMTIFIAVPLRLIQVQK